MSSAEIFALALDPARLLMAQGLTPDPWQRDLLVSPERCLLLNCSRQSGKSTTVAALALHRALFHPRSLVLLVAPAERQSHELFRKVMAAYRALGQPIPPLRANASELELANRSRIVALPGKEGTIRSFSGVSLLLIDEAARVPDDLYRSVRPMLAVSQGRLLALSTPFGQRGWFYEEWTGNGPWQRVHVPWTKCPRIRPEFIAEETRALGEAWVQQEYECLFTALAGLVYPDFPLACVSGFQASSRGVRLCEPRGSLPESAGEPPEGKLVGGIDFGWRNPFAAIWGVLDRDDVLWIHGERYGRETPLSDHAAVLPKKGMWYADPAGRTETEELLRRGLKVRPGDNSIRPGIAAVTARIRTGRLKVLPTCPNLIAESKLYRWPTASERVLHGENPIDADNHALAALRYLVIRLDAGRRPTTHAGLMPLVKGPVKEPTSDSAWTPTS